ncbi:neurotrimin isoform X7 [Pectinophora gossypiella]|uniref:neurotrimin isoform X1 n=1 Tax=Pectinophora gossypiella TaxID=13191 RepID=UPI00214EE9FB|nr:neurotrimin isoform X1 [Pectinophora gossypiella]XP_049882241.1 neurotrimin isoform X2 [Pectinophora gossypiella]XP_049882242.1 neurotrimin isoform X3 [Pectinophora gossypiella]XP_049882243.1 neurotrimin isoform X4 [Pectinophora gossypiella]XP_049882244.1 neurotrimin isoform X5 [Pectinophora gossypiella]XP_049882245.1 neurotrimin isoform X6 [Pectinophora gossypiella]XP_049882246.1 neurotrimin isoform X7 [Pectinophora gossypiella]
MLTLKQIVIFLLVNSVLSEKVFQSVPVTVKTYENDTVLLPCYINDSEAKLRVRWYKDNQLLGDSADPNHLLPPRTRMHANYSLQVDLLKAEDTADYTCEVIRPEPWGPIRQTHSIEVQYSPTIKTIPEDGFLEVKKGEYVDIGCDVSGTPAPIVDWRKNGDPMALLEHRSRIRFKAEHRLLAGVYECTANNGVGAPVSAHIRVLIHDAPVVTAERTFVHTAIGLRAALEARIEFAVPPARTAWYRDGRPVQTHDDRIVMMVKDNLHQLIFRSVRLSDLGNYTFRAQNKLGMADIAFKLTGVPNAASFKVDSALNKPTSTSFTLIWEVDSYSTIIEYNLWLRPYFGRTSEVDGITTEPPVNMWRKIVVPGDANDGPIHSARYTVRGLTPSTVYEAIVTSRNRFGWSKQSAVLHFATEPGTGRRPSTADYSEITPLLEEPESDSEPQAHNITQAQVFGRESSSGARETPSLSAILFIVGSLVCFVSYNHNSV